MLSSLVEVVAASAQRAARRVGSKPEWFNMDQTRPYDVAKERSTFPLCCGVSCVVYSGMIPSSFLIKASKVVLFSSV